MFSRDISTEDIEATIKFGEIIGSHPNDKPFPSCLVLGEVSNRPLHLVLAINETENKCIVITAYRPSTKLWDRNFKSKQK